MKQRISAKKKGELVMKLLRGGSMEEVSRESGVTVSTLSQWREQFIQQGIDGFKRNPQESMQSRYERIIGRKEMEIELLKKKNDFARKLREHS